MSKHTIIVGLGAFLFGVYVWPRIGIRLPGQG